ncbi:hypothetical protein HRI_003160500 [Hibiscus trionum]|uniref:Reverse transcriptase domain-containing protein n=1 Tax=Hibiscus trionum TaxID=183268 RepID=A0A9W7IGV2_HIBTR|nr:hypothetical protein HRI_003160500 [Hibiscus trionum]
MELPEKFRNWIIACYTGSKFSVSLNGSLVGFVKGQRGVRQGDPLSPYLFVIAMNVLSGLLDKAATQGIFQFHPKCKKLNLTHLCFADDLLVFCKGNVDSLVGVQCVLKNTMRCLI